MCKNQMHLIEHPVVLVTGVSSGIGLALARRLWNLPQYRVVVTARSGSLSKLASEPFQDSDRFLVRPLDVTVASERENLINEITARWGGVDVLINNAGISYRGVFEHMPDEDLQRLFSTNLFGPLAMMRLILPGMRARGGGRIINVSSVSGMMAMPTMSSYSASKFALEGATEALWYEVKPWNIKVTLIQPGFVHSESFKNTYYSKQAKEASIDSKNPYHFYYKFMTPFIERMMRWSISTPENIAKTILKTIEQPNPPLRISATFDAWVFGLLRRTMPRGLYHRLLYRSLPGIKQWKP